MPVSTWSAAAGRRRGRRRPLPIRRRFPAGCRAPGGHRRQHGFRPAPAAVLPRHMDDRIGHPRSRSGWASSAWATKKVRAPAGPQGGGGFGNADAIGIRLHHRAAFGRRHHVREGAPVCPRARARSMVRTADVAGPLIAAPGSGRAGRGGEAGELRLELHLNRSRGTVTLLAMMISATPSAAFISASHLNHSSVPGFGSRLLR